MEELIRLCSYCERELAESCRRCGTGLCRVHTPGVERHCEECEADFRADRSKRAVVQAATSAAVAALLLGVVLIFAIGTGGGALALAPLILFCAVPVTLLKLELRARSRFLAENVGRQLPRARLLERG